MPARATTPHSPMSREWAPAWTATIRIPLKSAWGPASTCHTDVAAKEDLRNIRMNGSLVDYDGDGDTTEGIAGEIVDPAGDPV